MTLLYNIGAICVLCAICLPFIIKSKAPDPEDKEEFDEKVIYGDFKEFVWKKKRKAK